MYKLAKKRLWVLGFIGANLLFILLQIYKHTVFEKYNYAQQRLERERKQLVQRKAQLMAELHAQQTPIKVQKLVAERLGLQKVALKQIKKLE